MRKLAGCRQQIVRQRSGQRLSVPVIPKVLEKSAAKALNDGTENLTVQGRRIDDAADILHGHIIENVDVAAARIDGYVGGVRAVTVCELLLRKRSSTERPENSASCRRLSEKR